MILLMQHHKTAADRAAQMASDLQTSCLDVRTGRLNRLVGRRFDLASGPLAGPLPRWRFSARSS